ncbi:MAG: hisJ, partial [Firmicutes bacterium]|nr:hisJ [Bacillota bacterium]
MKKSISVISLMLVFVLMIAGCGNSSSVSGDKSVDHSKKKIKIITYANWNPFEYLDNGKLVGFDVDLIEALSKEAGYDYEINNVGWDAMFEQLKSNTADVGISGITITDARKQTFDFSRPYFISRQSIVVKENSAIHSGEDLKGRKVAVQNGSTGQEAMEKLLGKNHEDIKKVKNGLSYMELIHGSVDAVVGDDTSNQEFIANNSDQGLKRLQDEKTFSPEYFGIMYPKDSKVRADFDKALEKLYENGTFAAIYKKWFKVEPNLE